MPQPPAVNHQVYAVPRKFRVAENMHIVLWLLKDMSWALKLQVLAVAMFLPTLLLALIITWQTRSIRSEWFHNLAVSCWIIANGLWMIAEFYSRSFETLRYYTAVPFSLGLLCVSYYYLTEFARACSRPPQGNSPDESVEHPDRDFRPSS